MSDPRYKADIVAGIALSRGVGIWPDELPGLGKKSGPHKLSVCRVCVDLRLDPLAIRSADRPQWDFVRYGPDLVPICKRHALELARRRPAGEAA